MESLRNEPSYLLNTISFWPYKPCHVARCSHQVTPSVNHDHPKGHFIINDHLETARAERQIVPQAKFFRIIVSKRVFYLPESNIFLIRSHQVMHEIPPGDAERPLRHLWLRACTSHAHGPTNKGIILRSVIALLVTKRTQKKVNSNRHLIL